MSQLRNHPKDDLYVQPYGMPPIEPGQLVGYRTRPGTTFGIVVSIDATNACVLWSREPRVVADTYLESGYVFAPYVPLIVTPTLLNDEPKGEMKFKYLKTRVSSSYYGSVRIGDL